MRLSGLIQPATVWKKSCRWKHRYSSDVGTVFSILASMGIAIFCIDACGFWFGMDFAVFVFFFRGDMNESFMQHKQMVP